MFGFGNALSQCWQLHQKRFRGKFQFGFWSFLRLLMVRSLSRIAIVRIRRSRCLAPGGPSPILEAVRKIRGLDRFACVWTWLARMRRPRAFFCVWSSRPWPCLHCARFQPRSGRELISVLTAHRLYGPCRIQKLDRGPHSGRLWSDIGGKLICLSTKDRIRIYWGTLLSCSLWRWSRVCRGFLWIGTRDNRSGIDQGLFGWGQADYWTFFLVKLCYFCLREKGGPILRGDQANKFGKI